MTKCDRVSGPGARLGSVCLAALIVGTSCGGVGVSPDPACDYSQAVTLANESEHREAARILKKLLDEQPDCFSAYSLYWRTLGKTDGTEAVLSSVRGAAQRFEVVSPDERTEDFYRTYLDLAERLDDADLLEALTREAVQRYPRGKIAQLERLDAAREDEDPLQSVTLLKAYIEEFPDNSSWASSAAADRFGIIAAHPDRFSIEQLRAAAEDNDRLTRAFVEKFGNPSRLLLSRFFAAQTFMERNPDDAIVWARRGAGFVVETAPKTEEFDESVGRWFAAIELMAQVDRGHWKEALAAAEELRLGTHEPIELTAGASFGEADVREAYAEALAEAGQVSAAAEQLSFAAALEPSREEALDAFVQEHELSRDVVDERSARFMAVREDERRARLLATREHRIAPAFALKDLEGREVTLSSFRGSVLVLNFFATWCGPCLPELEELQEAYAGLGNDSEVAIVAVSTDSDKSLVAPYIKERGCRFPVLYTDGSVMGSYAATTAIPQLYVIDAEGFIRFHRTGFDGKHFGQYLEWMIEAARMPSSTLDQRR